jgi:dephospho-CoA kinase
MLRAGITGGIGSGKSFVCQAFAALGIPVFNADDAARHLMQHDPNIISGIKDIFGAEAYNGQELQRRYISAQAYNNPTLLQKLNALVHPATISYGAQWMQQHANAPYIIKEAAIFFESGTNKDMDVMIGVHAPQETRIRRAMARSGISREQVMVIIANQMDEDAKMKLCDHVIVNDDTTAVLPQVLRLHQIFTTT